MFANINQKGCEVRKDNKIFLLDGRIIWFQGYFFVGDRCFMHETAAKYLLNLHKSNQLRKRINGLNGIFNCMIIDESIQEVCVFTDRFNFSSFYYYIDKGKCLLSDDFFEIASQVPTEMDPVSVLEFLKYRNVTGSRTLCKNIFSILPARIYRLDYSSAKYQWGVVKYWDYKFKTVEISKQEVEKRLFEIMNGIVKRYIGLFNNSKFALNLSGGLDSRFLLSLFLKNNYSNNKLGTYTFGHESSDEIKISSTVAEQAGVKHYAEIFSNESIELISPKIIDEITKIIGGITYYDHGYGPYRLAKKFYDDVTFLMQGDCGFIVGLEITKEVNELNSLEETVEKIYNDAAIILRDKEIHKILNYKPKPRDIKQLLKKRIRDNIRDTSSSGKAMYFKWNQQNRERNYCNKDYEFFKSKTIELFPFYDYEWMDFMLSLPFEHINEQVTYINSIFKYAFVNKESFLREIPVERRGVFKECNEDYKPEGGMKPFRLRNLIVKIIRKCRPLFFVFHYIRKVLIKEGESQHHIGYIMHKEKPSEFNKNLYRSLNYESKLLCLPEVEKLIKKNINNSAFFPFRLPVILTLARFENVINNMNNQKRNTND